MHSDPPVDNHLVRAVWISDMSGFTRDTRIFGTETVLERIAVMRSVIRHAVDQCAGYIFKVDADNLYALFERPEQAIQASCIARSDLPAHTKICIGVGFGLLLYKPEDNDYYGLEINLASKLGEDTACPDEILLTEAAFKALPNEMSSACAGPFFLDVGGFQFPYYRYDSNS